MEKHIVANSNPSSDYIVRDGLLYWTSSRGMEKRIVAQLLTSMDSLCLENTGGKPVIVIGATNRCVLIPYLIVDNGISSCTWPVMVWNRCNSIDYHVIEAIATSNGITQSVCAESAEAPCQIQRCVCQVTSVFVAPVIESVHYSLTEGGFDALIDDRTSASVLVLILALLQSMLTDVYNIMRMSTADAFSDADPIKHALA